LARLVLTGRARSQFAGLPPPLQDAVKETLADLAVEPEGVGKPLLGKLAGVWAARVGNYRVLYTIEGPGGSQRVVVRSILHRAVAYGRKRRRQ
jgi:mRNA-degrading endonuclease RelE of RelBE toxin-antitoxin system